MIQCCSLQLKRFLVKDSGYPGLFLDLGLSVSECCVLPGKAGGKQSGENYT